jgi:hypothetical protein
MAAAGLGELRALGGAEPHPTSVEALVSAFRRLDRRLEKAVARMEASQDPEPEGRAFRGLYIGPADVSRNLEHEPGRPRLASEGVGDPSGDDPTALLGQFDPSSRFGKLGRIFGFLAFDLGVVLIALAPEFDLKYERIYAYLQDDVSRRRPSVDLALDLLCSSAAEKLARRAHFAHDAPLLRTRVLKLLAHHTPEGPLPSCSIRLDEHIVRVLLLQTGLDSRLGCCCRLGSSDSEGPGAVPSLSDRELRSLASSVVRARKERLPLRLYFQGPPGAGQAAFAAKIAAEACAQFLWADLTRWPAAARPEANELIHVLLREALMRSAVLYLEPWDVLFESGGAGPQMGGSPCPAAPRGSSRSGSSSPPRTPAVAAGRPRSRRRGCPCRKSSSAPWRTSTV